jgi:DNA-binding Xre family transcriptional regulator
MKKRDEIIWNNVLKLANKKGWNKTRLAKEVGTNTSVLNNIKDSTRGIGNKLLAKFSVALEVSESEWIKKSVDI